MIKKFTISILLFLISIFSVFSQDSDILVIDEEMAVSLAIENSASLKMSKIDLAILENTKNTVWNNLLPSIVVGADLSRNNSFLNSTSPSSESARWSSSLSGGLSFSFSSSNFFNWKNAQLDYEEGLYLYNNELHETEKDVRTSFYNLLINKEAIRIAKQSKENAENIYQSNLQSYKSGRLSEMVLLKSQLSFQNSVNQYNEKSASYNFALETFRDDIGIGRETKIDVEGSIAAKIILIDEEKLLAENLENHENIKKQKRALEKLIRQKKESVINAYSPIFSASYSLDYGNLFSSPDLGDLGAFKLAVSINLDSLIPGSKNNNTLFYAKDRAIEKQELLLAQTTENLRTQLHSTISKINRMAESIKALELSQSIAERSLSLTRNSYAQGGSPYADVLSASEALDSARQNVLTALVSYRTEILKLECLLGISLQE